MTNESGLRSRVKSALRASRGWPVDLHPGPAADAVMALISPAGEVFCDDPECDCIRIAAPRGMEG